MALKEGRHVAGLQKFSPRGGDERPHGWRGGLDLSNERLTTVDDGDDVLQVMAGDRIPTAAVMKRRQLCSASPA